MGHCNRAGQTSCKLFYLGEPRATGFPVEPVGVDALHAAFLDESRPRGRIRRSVQEIRVPQRSLQEGVSCCHFAKREQS